MADLVRRRVAVIATPGRLERPLAAHLHVGVTEMVKRAGDQPAHPQVRAEVISHLEPQRRLLDLLIGEVRTALSSGTRRTFRVLHDRVATIAAALCRHVFRAGDRLAMLLPNEPDYLEVVYACAWLGVIAVPVNIRLLIREIDHLIADANPRGLIRHSSLPVLTVKPP